jgi:cytochrome oxidase Cu insertion factor (SCO1/SenC/PrrC family)
MKKFIFLAIGFFLILLFLLIKTHNNSQVKNAILAGSYAKDFIIGMKNSAIYRLSDFIGKYNIILAFLDTSPQSDKINNIVENSNLNSFINKSSDIIWFNILKDDNNRMTIEEKTQKINLSYRTLSENILKFYNLKNFPSIIIINKEGVIHLVYSGYSPTVINDILDTLKTLTQ